MDHSASLEESKPERASGPVVDPVCGMTVNPDSTAGSLIYDDQTYYFCSQHCLQEFRKAPGHFTKTTAGSMNVVPVGIQPRKSPATSGSASAGYTCPMHPEIVRDVPGNCPICGMALEPRTVSLDEAENHELVLPQKPPGVSTPIKQTPRRLAASAARRKDPRGRSCS